MDVILWSLIIEISFVNKFLNNWLRNTLFDRVWSADYFDIFFGIQICLFQCIFVCFLPKYQNFWYCTFFTSIKTNQHLEVVNPNSLYTFSVIIIMEEKKAANYNNLLLDNYNTSIPITSCVSTPVGTAWRTGENSKFSKLLRGES